MLGHHNEAVWGKAVLFLITAHNPNETDWLRTNRLARSYCHRNTKTLRIVGFYVLEPQSVKQMGDSQPPLGVVLCDCLDGQTDRHPGKQHRCARSEPAVLGLSVSWEDGNLGRYVTSASQALLHLSSFKMRTAFHGRKMLCS